MQRKPGGPLRPVGMSRKPHDETTEHGVLRSGGGWSDDAATTLLLHGLLQDLSVKFCGLDVSAESLATSALSGARVDDLIYLSAEMRGLIFRAYARRIADLLASGGRMGEGRPGGRRLN
jgi:hypothetical protein